MTRTINYGLIGCGMMGQEHLHNIGLLEGTRVAAIFEPDPVMAKAAKAIAPDATMVSSVKELLAVEDLDCLVIASPNHLHVDQICEVAETRPLPLLVEKPLFTDPQDAARLEEVERSYPCPIWVAMEYRYMPPIAALIDKAEATGGVKMLSVREHRFPFLEKVGHWNRFNRNTGGTFVEKCCHFFDLMRLILQSDPVQVTASGGQAVNHLDESYEGETPDILDHGYVIVDFASGARAMLELCMFAEGSRYQEEISAVGPDAKVEALVPGPGRFWPDHLGEPPVPKVIVSPRNPKGPTSIDVPVDARILAAGDHNGSTYYQHQGFLAVLRGEKAQPDVSLKDGLWAVRMGHAAQQAMESGETVRLGG
ncbi:MULTISPECIES: Gfo/Idh/MocA family protein [unclassified Ruegeria]|uniref:Gfo/Idh/MocA family protein n=1 Tax=unclassified Ruegeria TaxID=2625375 RepID=UPI00148777B6|nr:MULTISPECIES: Gfo/Idh/MocA family oxidoreductase [unclassified Ruegeria]NOD64897.1 Gfo/Idh/MocA family oxidoreductase [Ruegeria sp. HKCCD6109]